MYIFYKSARMPSPRARSSRGSPSARAIHQSLTLPASGSILDSGRAAITGAALRLAPMDIVTFPQATARTRRLPIPR